MHAPEDLKDPRMLRGFHQRCTDLIRLRHPRVALELEHVTAADSKLLAVLLLLIRQAHGAGVDMRMTVSHPVWDWVSVCRVAALLRPYIVAPDGLL